MRNVDLRKLGICLVLLMLCGVCFGQQRLIVPPFQDRNSGIDASTMETLTDLFINSIQRTNRFDVPDRNALALLSEEANFQLSDWSDDRATVEKGRVLNADYILRVIVSKIDTNAYLLLARLLQVPSAQILDSAEFEFTTVRDARPRLDAFAKECLDNIKTASEIAQQQKLEEQKLTKVYKIGEYGPAGGIVFYDKGKVSDGWRYLEAAPFETEIRAYLLDAQNYSENLIWGGVDNWFLPPRDVLNYMYINLKKNNLGNFKNASYWSSPSYGDSGVWTQDFQFGMHLEVNRNAYCYARAYRAF